MERFIVLQEAKEIIYYNDLKSSMERFIVMHIIIY